MAAAGSGPFTLPPLPFALDALAPHISAEQLDYHYNKHHQAYVTKLNAAAASDSSIGAKSLEEHIKTSSGAVFNNAAQIWNHTFYWNSMAPGAGGEPPADVAEVLTKNFESVENFKKAFTDAAAGHFGSGWAWLVRKSDGSLAIVDTHDAGNPLKDGHHPLLACDVWEHAYYVDYRNARPDYIKAWWNVVNWEFLRANLAK